MDFWTVVVGIILIGMVVEDAVSEYLEFKREELRAKYPNLATKSSKPWWRFW
jgi:hypothetical protein